MNLKAIRQVLTVFCIFFLVFGGVFVLFINMKQQPKKTEDATIVPSMEHVEIDKNNLRTYLNHTKEEVEQAIGNSMIIIELNGITVATPNQNYSYFLFLEENKVKAIMFQKNEGELSVDGIKLGETLQGQKQTLEQNYNYKSYLFQGAKFDLYNKKDGNYVLGFAVQEETNRISGILLYMKEYEDTVLKQGLGSQNGVEWEYTGFILEDSDKQYIEKETLEKISERELILAKSEIYARYGYQFEDENIQRVFNRTEWYEPKQLKDDFSEKDMNPYERENIRRIEEVIQEKTGS
ncbi:MAG: YARHG domain-containing protein [Firmicutes bacterium]|uniref:YARHG domain-containing protein n=1 Tax=Candidatus Scybalomonas excrementavium TaxID=2840943 RepID=A0A9D9HZX7_9FIRM|nr:YARHG domain-containing protein [Candidatus Scybalomonas excrementavium]